MDSNCPWRVKRVAKARKPPWLNSSVTTQLRERDRLLKIGKRSQNPADWESYKAARKEAVTNYRPISVLPTLSKVAERHVHNELRYSFLSENDLIYTRQLAFRPRHSTETALIKVIHDLLFNLDNDCVSGMVLIDYRKAFGVIDHTLLLTGKLEVYGLIRKPSNGSPLI